LFTKHSDYEKNISDKEVEHKNELEKIKSDEQDWSSELKDLVMLVRNKKDDIVKQISSENEILMKLRDEAKDLQNKIKEIELELKSISDLNKLANTKESLEKDLTIFAGNINSKKLQIESIEKDLKDYNFYAEVLKDNETKKISIKSTEYLISKLKTEYSELLKGLQKSETEIELINERIEKANQQIELYLKQIKVDQLHKAYQTCVHRDGIPTLLLKSMIEHINTELEEMFSEVDFVSYFDENLVLRLSDKNRLDVFQHAISSSGKERTFVALGLKMALRTINKKSKPDILLLDEIMGKLIGNSVDEFRGLLNIAKQKVSRLMIIEHVHHIDYDHLIEVSKNSEGVTSLN
jgi:DNA repair exonuclease SbcCD ATPase subunit